MSHPIHTRCHFALPLLLVLFPMLATAQSPTSISPSGSFTTSASGTQLQPSTPAITAAASARELQGRWQHQRHDQEHDERETTTVEMLPDGRYSVQMQSDRRQLQKQPPLKSVGRYVVEQSDATGHVVRFEGEPREPDVGKEELVTRVKLSVKDGKAMTTSEGLNLVRIQ